MSDLRRRLPPLATLVVFEAAYRLGSFSRAAKEVYLTQASVSRRIKQLEDNLKVNLFERRRHDVRPTVEGDMLATTVYLTLNELASTAQELREKGSKANSFTIFSDISIGRHLITPCLDDFQRRYPSISFRLISSYDPIETLNQEFDLGFQVGRWAEDKFDIEAVADDAVFPVCSASFAKNLPKDLDPAGLTKYPLLHLEDVGRDWINWKRFLAHFRVREPEKIDGLVFTSYQVCLDAAEQGKRYCTGLVSDG